MEFLFFSPNKNFFLNVDWVFCYVLFWGFFDADYKIIHVRCKEKLEATDNYLEDKTPQADSLGG